MKQLLVKNVKNNQCLHTKNTKYASIKASGVNKLSTSSKIQNKSMAYIRKKKHLNQNETPLNVDGNMYRQKNYNKKKLPREETARINEKAVFLDSEAHECKCVQAHNEKKHLYDILVAYK